MKKLVTLFSLLITAICVNAYDVVVNEMCYDLDNENMTATVVQDKSYVYQYLGDIVIPETINANGKTYTVNRIGEYAFFYSKGLTSVTIPETVEKIDTYAFSYCDLLEELTIPSKVKVIENYTFSDDINLKVINLPEGLETIGEGAFYNCAIESITLPATMKEISGTWTFNMCKSLKEIHANMTKPMNIGQNTFDQAQYDGATLYVPTGTKAVYEETMYWDMFANIVEEKVTPTGIKNAAVEETEDGKMYDLQGRRIYAPVKGVYIQNGKKIVK